MERVTRKRYVQIDKLSDNYREETGRMAEGKRQTDSQTG